MKYLFLITLLITFAVFHNFPTVMASGIPGDANNDGKVDGIDYVVWVTNFNKNVSGGNTSGDFDNNGFVDGLDYVIWLNNYGTIATVSPSLLPTKTPTRTPSRTPTPVSVTNIPNPTISSSGVYRPFSANSYWNKPMPANAPIDSHNSIYISDSQNTSHTQNYMKLGAAPDATQAYGYPIYWAKDGDPWYTIDPSGAGQTLSVRIPAGAQQASGTDAAIISYDIANNVVIELYQANYNSTTHTWTAGATKRWYLNSLGLDGGAAGTDNTGNFGHRGEPSEIRAIRVDEVRAGAINHRLECFWWATGNQYQGHYWPMIGDEGAKGGIVPEGIVIRIKPSVDLRAKGLNNAAYVIAKSLQDYGCMVGDNTGTNKVVLELNKVSDWTSLGINSNSLSPIPWSDWEFIQGGYNP